MTVTFTDGANDDPVGRKVLVPVEFAECGCCVEETMVCDAHAVDHWNPAIWH